MTFNNTKSHDFTAKFHKDLRHGQSVEADFYRALHDAKVEVKADDLWHQSQRIAIEYRYNGEPSGVSTTEAKYWAHALTDSDGKPLMYLVLPVAILKQLMVAAKDEGLLHVKGGDKDRSSMMLIPLQSKKLDGKPTLWDLLDKLW